MKIKFPSIESLASGALKTFLRFPFALVSAIAGTCIAIYLTEREFEIAEHLQFLFNLLMCCGLGLVLFTSLTLYLERMGANAMRKIIIQIIGLALLTGYYFYLPIPFTARHIIQFCLFILGLHLLVAFAAHIFKGNDNGFWQFNKNLFIRFLTAFLYSNTLYLGLTIALLAIDQLFGVHIRGERYFQLWIFLVGIFNTWFFLAGVPQNLDELDSSEDYPKGLKIFTQYVLLPLVTIYLGILYAYAVKLIINFNNWPKGWVAYLVIGFSVAGILSLLLVHPVQDKEDNRWIKIYSRWFYLAIFPLIVLLALSIWKRVAQYGITENRYFIIILALWLAGIAAYFSLSKKRNIKAIPISLCFLAFFTSFGPWGAFSVSERSQMNRLEKILADNHLLVNGKYQKSDKEIPCEARKEITAILKYMDELHGMRALQPWFKENMDSLVQDSVYRWRHGKEGYELRMKHYYDENEVLELMDIKYTTSDCLEPLQSTDFSYGSDFDENGVIPVSGYDYYVYIYKHDDGWGTNNSFSYNIGDDSIAFDYLRDEEKMDVKINGNLIGTLDWKKFIDQLKQDGKNDSYNYNILREKMSWTADDGKSRVKIYFIRFNGNREEEKADIKSITARVLVKVK